MLYKKRSILSVEFDLTSGPPEIWQDHHISRTGGPMVHCLELSISSPARHWLGMIWAAHQVIMQCSNTFQNKMYDI